MSLEEFFSPSVPCELSDTLCDPISEHIMIFPVFCNGRTFDRCTLEGNHWKDPFSREDIDQSKLQLNLAVDTSIEKYLQKCTTNYVTEEIEKHLNHEDVDRNTQGIKNIVSLMKLLGDGKRRDTYLNASRVILQLLQQHYDKCIEYCKKEPEDTELILNFIFDRSGYPSDHIAEFKEKGTVSNLLIFRILEQSPILFQSINAERLFTLFQLPKLFEATPILFKHVVIHFIKSLKLNPLQYMNSPFAEKLAFVRTLSESSAEAGFTNEEVDLLLKFDDNIPEVPQDILQLKLRAIEFLSLQEDIKTLKERISMKNVNIEQLKYRIFIYSLLPTHNTVRFVSKEDNKRCLTAGGKLLRCDLIANDSSAKFQEWVLTAISSLDGRQGYVISNPATNKSVDNDHGKSVPGNHIILWTKNETNPNQQWQILPIIDSYVTIRNLTANGVMSYSPKDHYVTLEPTNPQTNWQLFSLEPF